jgi:hypothetical protein
VVGNGDHHGLNANRQPKVPAVIPAIGGEGVGHHVRTEHIFEAMEAFIAEIVSETVAPETGVMFEPRAKQSSTIVRILPRVAH